MNKTHVTDFVPGHSLNQLREEHHKLEAQLEELNNHAYISTAEQMEIKRLKKLKLIKKEQIQALATKNPA